MSTNVPAPGELELVQRFLNTWALPNDTRVPVDRLGDLASHETAWADALPGLDLPTGGELSALKALRTTLRDELGRPNPVGLGELLTRYPLAPQLHAAPADRPVSLRPVVPSPPAELLARALNAVVDAQWHRLKACPDCRYVFYDISRNASRTWCAMSPDTPDGRGCGGIAKARAHRQRSHAAELAETQ